MAHVPDVGAHTYRPSARMREYIEARDEHCRFPACRQPAHRSAISTPSLMSPHISHL